MMGTGGGIGSESHMGLKTRRMKDLGRQTKMPICCELVVFRSCEYCLLSSQESVPRLSPKHFATRQRDRCYQCKQHVSQVK